MSQNLTPPPMPGYGPPVPPPAPKKTPTAVIAIASAAAAALAAAAITAGVTTSDEAQPAPAVTVTETVAEGDAASAADADNSEPAPEESDDHVFALSDTVTYDSDVAVALSGFKRAVSSTYASPENTPYLRFTAKITNGGSKTLDTTQLIINCSYGADGHSSEPIFDTGLEGGPETKLLSGRSINVPWGCALPKNASLIQIEVGPDYDSETAIFTGTVK